MPVCQIKTQPIAQDSAFLRFLYRTLPGRFLLRLLSARWLSRLCGTFLDSRLSRPLISPFIKKNGIDLSEYYTEGWCCFNDCFTRKIREDRRPIDQTPQALISPCDGLMSAYLISDDTVLAVKQSRYTVSSLLGGDEIARRYHGGICLVFRLCVNHYHRYCYIDDGEKGKNVFLPGVLHTVRPVALRTFPVFCENCREYTVMQTAHFGTVTQIEVGAMLVGKIKNDHQAARITRGMQKGMFLYGGSTVILLLEKDRVNLPQAYFDAAARGEEIPVRMGERLN